MHLYPIDGAVRRVGKSDTAWNTRDATWSMVIAGIDPNPQKAGEITRWTKGYWEAVHPYSADGAHRTGQADFPHPALGQDFTLSRATPSAASEHLSELIGFPISRSFTTEL